MATKKDLVEAYSFSRRRLVTAFVSGAPGGREVEPARPGRTIVGGLALAVLLAAGAAIAGVFAPRTPTDWTQAGLIISKDTGAPYVIVDADEDDPELRPVINITSAQLILGPDIEPMTISQGTIDAQRVGDDIGILGAPATLPDPDRLIESGWTSCTAAGHGIRVRVAESPSVSSAEGRQVLVRSDGELFLVAQPPGDAGPSEAYVLRVPEQRRGGNTQTDTMLLALQAGVQADAVEVPREWLNLFPRGGDLDWSTFDLDRVGRPAEGAGETDSNVPKGAVIGDILVSDEGAALLTADGPVDLDPFSLAVYDNIDTPIGFRKPIQVGELPNRAFDKGPFDDAHWPTQTLDALGDTDPCAQLLTEAGQPPMAQLAQAPGDDAAVGSIPATGKAATVDPGRGAYVLSGGWDDADHGAPYAIDAKGRANPLVGAHAASQLVYGDYPVPVVPDSWVKLFDKGVDLSKDAALCPPALPGTGGASCE